MIEPLSAQLGHTFRRPALLALALTHRSWCAEHPGYESNERLEFLGDAVLGLVVTDYLYRGRPDLPEGAMAKVRSAVVSSPTLAQVAGGLPLGEGLRLGKGEEATGGRAKPSILADALEAVIGAVYLDGGFAAARTVILGLVEDQIGDAVAEPGTQDYKTRLQELVARHHSEPPGYEVSDEGPDHAKHFRATVTVGGVIVGEGEGRSKKQAQQAAAQSAWLRLVAELADDGPAPTP